MSIESEGLDLLRQRLDEELRDYAAEAVGIQDRDGKPMIENIYLLQGMTETHCLLKGLHPFTPQEVNALLKFQKPLAVAHACWEENTEKYSFDICQIIKDNKFDQTFALVDQAAAREEKPSVRDQLHTAMRDARRQAKAEQGRTEPPVQKRGGEAL